MRSSAAPDYASLEYLKSNSARAIGLLVSEGRFGFPERFEDIAPEALKLFSPREIAVIKRFYSS